VAKKELPDMKKDRPVWNAKHAMKTRKLALIYTKSVDGFGGVFESKKLIDC
jgi:hypothetical protein